MTKLADGVEFVEGMKVYTASRQEFPYNFVLEDGLYIKADRGLMHEQGPYPIKNFYSSKQSAVKKVIADLQARINAFQIEIDGLKRAITMFQRELEEYNDAV